jgi:sugar phosphate isomerase/epimerase
MSSNAYPIAVQLYNLRYVDTPLGEKLAKVAEIGYDGVEMLQDHDISATETKDLLDKNGLKVSSAHISLQKLEDDLDGVVAFSKAIDNSALVVPALPQEMRDNDGPGWERIGRRLGELGKRCADQGIRLGYHNHSFEMVKVDSRLALEWLFDGAGVEDLFWEPDLAWIQHGGVDPVELLGRYTGRCLRIHAKDLAPAGENQDQMGLADVGYGVLDWNAILPACKVAGAEWFIVEHDLPSDPFESITRSYQFLSMELNS